MFERRSPTYTTAFHNSLGLIPATMNKISFLIRTLPTYLSFVGCSLTPPLCQGRRQPPASLWGTCPREKRPLCPGPALAGSSGSAVDTGQQPWLKPPLLDRTGLTPTWRLRCNYITFTSIAEML